MRKSTLSLFLILMLSCEKKSINIDVDEVILGRWQQTAFSYSIGGPQLTKEIENGVIFEFKENLVFSVFNVKTNEIKEGIFQFNNDTLVRIFKGDVESVELIDKTIITNNTLQLIPLEPEICIDGCSSTFKKL